MLSSTFHVDINPSELNSYTFLKKVRAQNWADFLLRNFELKELIVQELQETGVLSSLNSAESQRLLSSRSSFSPSLYDTLVSLAVSSGSLPPESLANLVLAGSADPAADFLLFFRDTCFEPSFEVQHLLWRSGHASLVLSRAPLQSILPFKASRVIGDDGGDDFLSLWSDERRIAALPAVSARPLLPFVASCVRLPLPTLKSWAVRLSPRDLRLADALTPLLLRRAWAAVEWLLGAVDSASAAARQSLRPVVGDGGGGERAVRMLLAAGAEPAGGRWLPFLGWALKQHPERRESAADLLPLADKLCRLGGDVTQLTLVSVACAAAEWGQVRAWEDAMGAPSEGPSAARVAKRALVAGVLSEAVTIEFRSRLASQEQLALPSLVLTDFLGGGAHGRVFAGRLSSEDSCEDGDHPVSVRMLQERVAVKILPLEASEEAVMWGRVAEAAPEFVLPLRRVARGLCPPQVMQPSLLLVTDLCDFTLKRYIEEHGGVPLRRALRWLRTVAFGLRSLHGRGLVHGDVSTRNVLVRRDIDRAVLADFGLTALCGQTPRPGLRVPLTEMPPEQLRALPEVDSAADVFQFGLCCFEVLAGRPLFARVVAERGAEEFCRLMKQESADSAFWPLFPPEEMADQRGQPLPPLIADVIRHCLRQDPVGRPTMGSVGSRLVRLQLSLPDSPAVCEEILHEI